MAPSVDFRQGTCTSCKNSFRVPATFAAPKAKCPKCGGVVEIGPVQAGTGGQSTAAARTETAASTAPSAHAAAAPAPSAAPTPAKAAPPKPAPTPLPANVQPAPQFVVAASAPVAEPEAKPAPQAAIPPASPVKESVRTAASAAAARVKSSPPAAKKREGATERAARRGADKTEGAEREKAPAPTRMAPLLVGAIVVVVLGFAGWYFGVYAPGIKAADAENAAKAAQAKQDAIDLAKLSDAARLEKTEEAEFKAMTDLMTRYITPPYDKTAEQAGDRLVIRGKAAIPAILNGFKRLDLTTEEGNSRGLQVQMLLLGNLSNGVDFGWKRDRRPPDVAFNKQVIQRWFDAWNKAHDDDAAWAAIKAEASAPAKPAGANK